MSYTGTEIKDMAIVIIDELSDAGTVDLNKTKEYGNRAVMLLDMWQKEISKTGDLFRTFELSCFRKKNLLGEFDSFLIIEHEGGTDQPNYTAEGVNCFYFGVDSEASVYIEQLVGGTWTGVSGTYIDEQTNVSTAFTGLINANTTTSSFNHYKGVITATGTVRIRFSGDYYYRHMNRALCPHNYPSVTKVPSFKAWYKIDMPTDFKSRTQVISEYPMWQYEEASSKWENGNELYVQFGYEGIIRVNYIPVPIKITLLTQTIEVDDVTALSGAYYLAEHFAIADMNDELASMCRNKFKSLKIDSMVTTPLSNTEIVDFYKGGGS